MLCAQSKTQPTGPRAVDTRIVYVRSLAHTRRVIKLLSIVISGGDRVDHHKAQIASAPDQRDANGCGANGG